jgi:ABC-2 type transport system permease protein
MDAPTAPARPVKINRWLPYWAVFQADVGQTLRSWVYRTWVLISVLSAVGYLLYRVGVYREAGIIQNASVLVSDLLRWTVVGSVTLIVVLTVGSISSERGSMADSVLSRGISRFQYYAGKWHARLATILCSFLVMGLLWLAASFFLLHEDVHLIGALVALATVATLLMAVISCGVMMSALTNSTLLGIAVLWMALYGASFALTLLPAPDLSLERVLARLPYILRGHYDLAALGRLFGWCLVVSVVSATVGMAHFARRDV